MTERERLALAVCEALRVRGNVSTGVARLQDMARYLKDQGGWRFVGGWVGELAAAYEAFAACPAEPAAEPAWKKGDRVRVVARPTVPEAYRAERGATDSDRDVAGEVGTILRAGTSSPPLPEWYVEFGEGLPRRRYLWECNLERLPADCCQSCGGPLGDKEVAL